MKNKTEKICLATLLLITTTSISISCSNNDNSSMEWDIYPFELNIIVVDEQGNNLMDPLVENNLTLSGITAHFRDSIYQLYDFNDYKRTRYYMPKLYGLTFQNPVLNGYYRMNFGELDGTDDIDNEEFVINWQDGTTNVISIDRKFWWKKNKPKSKQRITFDGEVVEPFFTIIKEPSKKGVLKK